MSSDKQTTTDFDFVKEVILTILLGLLAIYAAFVRSSKPRVAQVLVYPIKSCAEISLVKAVAYVTGFDRDRMFQVSDKSSSSSKDGTTYCTPRDPQYAKLFHVQPTLKDDNDTLVLTAPNVAEPLEISLRKDQSRKTVQATPMVGPKVTLEDYGPKVSAWLESAVRDKDVSKEKGGTLILTGIGKGYQRKVQVNPDQSEALPTTTSSSSSDNVTNDPQALSNDGRAVSLADEAPFLLTSTSSLDDLNARLKARGVDPVDMRRFRPNIVVRGLPAWQEDTWSRIRIGTVEFHVWQRCGRCAMTTIDRDSLHRGPEPLATLSTFRERDHGQRNFGMHLIPVASTCPGLIKVGAEIEVLQVDRAREAEWKELFGPKK